VGYALLLANFLELSDRFSPAVADYWSRLNTRRAFQAAKRVQKGDLATELSSL
jgi:glutathione S-transferase